MQISDTLSASRHGRDLLSGVPHVQRSSSLTGQPAMNGSMNCFTGFRQNLNGYVGFGSPFSLRQHHCPRFDKQQGFFCLWGLYLLPTAAEGQRSSLAISQFKHPCL